MKLLNFKEIEELLSQVEIPDADFKDEDDILIIILRLRKQRNKAFLALQNLMFKEADLEVKSRAFKEEANRHRQRCIEAYEEQLSRMKTVAERNDFLDTRIAPFLDKEMPKVQERLEQVKAAIRIAREVLRELESLFRELELAVSAKKLEGFGAAVQVAKSRMTEALNKDIEKELDLD